MNKNRRKQLDAVVKLLNALEEAKQAVVEALEEPKGDEREYYDSMPESFQSGEKGSAADAAATLLEEVYDELEAFDIADLIGKVEEAQA